MVSRELSTSSDSFLQTREEETIPVSPVPMPHAVLGPINQGMS
jgi:hypothetical protein